MFYIKSSDNAKIAVYDLNPKGFKETVVLVHGWPLSHEMFEYQNHVLLEAGYRVISFDIRGFGNSDETAEGYCYDQLATDLYYVVRGLNLNRFILIGFSMGGAIATRYMALYNGYRVSKLCYWDAAIPSFSKTIQNSFGSSIEGTNKLIRMGYHDRPALNQYFGSIFYYKRHSEPYRSWQQIVSDSASGIGVLKTLITLRDEDLFEDLKCIHVPTGIFHGKEDRICAFGMAKITHANIPDSKLYAFENAGHGAYYDCLEQFNQRLLEFLKC